jgi:cytochrome c peroxidase
MKRESQWSAFCLCVGVAVLAFLVSVSSVAAQGDDNGNGQNDNNRGGGGGDDNGGFFAVRQGPGTNTGNCPAQPPPSEGLVNAKVYCPYPPGIIPSDLTTESERVRREIRGIEQQAMADMAALGPLMPTSPNQVLANNGVKAVQVLGKLENYDENLSVFKNVACAFCHMPYTGFSGPISSVNQTTVAYPGSVHFRFGKRKPQSYDYSPYYPPLQFNLTQANFYGGNFWDLRATGYKIRSADGEQSQWPPLDSQEMGLPDFGCMVFRLSQTRYRPLFEGIWGNQSFDINWPENTEKICRTPAGAFGTDPTPLHLSPKDRGTASSTFNAYADSISAFEQGPEVSPFSSKFDAFLAGTKGVTLTGDEMAGYNLFRGKGNCNSCHLDGRSTAPSTLEAPSGVDTGAEADVQPLFTDTTSANLGLPKPFPFDPIYYENKPDSFGFTPNPAGAAFLDLGVGLFLRSQSGVNPNSAWTGFAPAFDGFMQVATARDVGMRPNSPTFVKAYMHNGYLKSLKEVVHFYNTRDRKDFAHPAAIGGCPTGFTEKVNCWPLPEVPGTKDMTIGNLGLTDTEENQIVAFLQTLTDGFTTPFPNANTFTGH